MKLTEVPYKVFLKMSFGGHFKWVKDETYLKICYRAIFRRKLNLFNPKTYTEKIQWLKLYNRDPIYTKLVDKYEVKAFVASVIGDNYIIPTIGVWNKFGDIDFSKLPNQFVLKSTHDSGGVVICKDKKLFNFEAAKEKLEKSLKNNFYYMGREWPYKNVAPRIICEQYMEDNSDQELRDYKIFCFNGKAKALFVATERENKAVDTKFDFFDMEYNHLNIINGHPNAEKLPHKPEHLLLMKQLAEKLTRDFPHVRVDFYEANGKIYFGELTFFHFSGFTPFEPQEWDYRFGDWLELPSEKKH